MQAIRLMKLATTPGLSGQPEINLKEVQTGVAHLKQLKSLIKLCRTCNGFEELVSEQRNHPEAEARLIQLLKKHGVPFQENESRLTSAKLADGYKQVFTVNEVNTMFKKLKLHGNPFALSSKKAINWESEICGKEGKDRVRIRHDVQGALWQVSLAFLFPQFIFYFFTFNGHFSNKIIITGILWHSWVPACQGI